MTDQGDGIRITPAEPEPFLDGRCPECRGPVATLVEALPGRAAIVLAASCGACEREWLRAGSEADTATVLAWIRRIVKQGCGAR